MNLTAINLGFRSRGFSQIFAKNARVMCRVLAGLYLWICFVKLPATAQQDSPAQSWEAVLSFATAHQLQWGRDIIFTFGPLGFLTSDYYWGRLFWPILLWALAFALVLTLLFLRLSKRIPASIRLILYVALPLLTTPMCANLGFDPIYFLSITLLGVACLPDERPGMAQLLATGVVFSHLSLIKFTFSLYGMCALTVIATANCLAGRWRNTGILATSWVASLLLTCHWSGQSVSSIPLYFARGWQLASGYSSAMGLVPKSQDLLFGIALLLGLATLLLTQWLRSKDWLRRTDRAVIVAAGTFLAWKEGFVRPDVHVVVFFLYSFFLAAMMPALMDSQSPIGAGDALAADPRPLPTRSSRPLRLTRTQLVLLLLTAAILFLSLTPLVRHRKDFAHAVQTGFVPRISDTLMAIFAPTTFKGRLEGQFESMRKRVALPWIQAAAEGATVGVLSYDQDVAILNGLNYAPHPVFQNYSAYTPELQRFNSTYFNSSQAPEYVLWRPRTLDGRFPTLDDGEILLRILTTYSPVMEEKDFVLWKRNPPGGTSYSLANRRELVGSIGQWIPIATEPTWLRVELQQTWFGTIRSLLLAVPEVRIEVRLENGRTSSYRLVPGNARHGFVLSPLLRTPANLLPPGPNRRPPASVVAVRVRTASSRFFDNSVRFIIQTIRNVPALESEPATAEPESESSEN